MGRRKSARGNLVWYGRTPEGRLIVRNVFGFYETHGLPLDDIFAGLWRHNALPDWIDLYDAMIRAGRPAERTLQALIAAVNDACYPLEFRDGIVAGLERLHAVKNHGSA